MGKTWTQLGVLLGWSWLLLLPWLLSGRWNPSDSPSWFTLLIQLAPPLLFVLSIYDGSFPGASFLRKRYFWYSRRKKRSWLRFLSIGFATGFLFSFPSVVFSLFLSASVLGGVFSFWIIGLLLFGWCLHAFMFILSCFAATGWGRHQIKRLYVEERSEHLIAQTSFVDRTLLRPPE